MDYIIYFALTIGILVFIHELGHFAAARLCGMRADVFAIGFGKRLFGFNKVNGFTFGDLPKDFDTQGYTDYRLCLLPLGGYVKIAGMIDESMDTKFATSEPQPWEFRSKGVFAKSFVITAGVLMNLLLAWAIFWGANYFQGKSYTKTTVIGTVIENSAADKSGFLPNDKILNINGTDVNFWEEVRTEIFINTLGSDLNIKVERAGELVDLNIKRSDVPKDESEELFLIPKDLAGIDDLMPGSPAEAAGIQKGDRPLYLNNEELVSRHQAINIISSNKETEMPLVVLRGSDTLSLSVTPDKDGKIGVVLAAPIEFKQFGFFESIALGWEDIVRYTQLTFSMVGKVFGGKVEFGSAFGGPIKIAQFATKSADSGIFSFLIFLALLSLSLAIINILPFPVLDGGHLVIIIIEGIAKREIPLKIKLAIQNAGFALLILLMVFIIYNDIISLW